MKYIILSFFIGLNVGIFACRYLSKPKEPKPIISLTQEQVQAYIAAINAQREITNKRKGKTIVMPSYEFPGVDGSGTTEVSCPQPQGGAGVAYATDN